MATMPPQYFNRFDATKQYERHLFIAGRGLQSAELNEIQEHAASRLRGVADVLFRDGDVVRDAQVVVDPITGAVQCQSGAIYITGAVRGVPTGAFTIPVVGEVALGVRVIEEVVTALQDPDLRDPATGTRNYDQPGAERLRAATAWGWDGDGEPGDFFPVYTVIDGYLVAKEPPPNLDAITQALARYDRDSAGGTYVVEGLRVQQLPDSGGNQVYSLSEGRARVYGYGIEQATSRRVVHAAVPDMKAITNEPHVSSTSGSQRIDFDRTPGTAITSVSITAEKTVTLTHGVSTGAQDPLPDTSVLQIMSVTQGATTYTPTTDYLLTAGKVDWTPGGSEPAPGSTYSVTYRYITQATPTLVDDDGFTITGAVSGTLVLVSYSQKLPRFDRLCINQEGHIVWVLGVASDFYAQVPSVPPNLLAVATVKQTWTSDRTVINDGVRVVPMPELAAFNGRIDKLAQLIAQNRLESNIHTREAGAKKGLFVDPFLDESQRDAGTPQTAAVVDGVLMLPIAATVSQMGTDVVDPTTLARTAVVALDQPLRTGSMQINPYMAFDLLPAAVRLTPSVDRWTVVETTWASPGTARFASIGTGDSSRIENEVRDALIATQRTNIETLRSISVSYTITGFGAGEVLASITFDGVSRPTAGAVANGSGVVTGSFTVPAGIPAGNKEVVFIGAGGSRGTAVFSGQGTLERQTWQRQTTVTEIRWQSPPPPPLPPVVWIDPLAQTFTLDANTQVSGVDLWFTAAPTTDAVVQIRATAVGFPSQDVIAQAQLAPGSISVGGAHTRFEFPAPVHLLAGIEYAVVVLCNDATGAVHVAELGKFDSVNQRWITSQAYNIGVLLSSSNASTWTAHQDRDLTFRLVKADYTETTRTVSLGNVAVTAATDLMLMAFAERPSSDTAVEFLLTLPSAQVIRVNDGQPVQMPTAITGNVGVSAVLSGNDFSPVLFPGSQLVVGQIAATGDYVSRAVPAGGTSTVKVIYEGIVPSGATIEAFYKGPDLGDTWIPMGAPTTGPADDGYTEFIHTATGVAELTVQIKLVLTGTTGARPYARDLRVIVS